MQMKTPRFQEAQRGCLLRLQSAQVLFVGRFVSVLRAALLRSAVSTEGPRRDILGGVDLVVSWACEVFVSRSLMLCCCLVVV